MAKYVPITAGWCPNGSDYLARTVMEQDKQPVKTGLLDATGVPLYRVPDTVKFGFIPEVRR